MKKDKINKSKNKIMVFNDTIPAKSMNKKTSKKPLLKDNNKTSFIEFIPVYDKLKKQEEKFTSFNIFPETDNKETEEKSEKSTEFKEVKYKRGYSNLPIIPKKRKAK